jgi:hypothetical protein
LQFSHLTFLSHSKLINIAKADTIQPSNINIGENIDIFHKLENLNVAIKGAKVSECNYYKKLLAGNSDNMFVSLEKKMLIIFPSEKTCVLLQ